MTLTAVFGALFLLALFEWLLGRGRRQMLIGIAIAAPFYDSAFITTGPVSVSPFYFGVILYLGQVTVDFTRERHAAKDPRRTLLLLLWAWTFVVTITAPNIFAGTPVYSSSGGLDEQAAGYLASLDYSSSNIAQIVYLTLNVAFALAAIKTRDLGPWFIRIIFIVGTFTAAAIYLGNLDASSLVRGIFDNSPRNSYADPTDRLRAQFAEPSHMGAFALTAGVYFVVTSFSKASAHGRRSVSVVLAILSFVLMLASVSGTALGGAGLTLLVVLLISVPRVLSADLRVPPMVVVALHLVAIVAVFTAGSLYTFGQGILTEKQRTSSLATRSSADDRARQLIGETWGYGVGLGSNRASSMLFLLLSTIGIVGTLLFLMLVYSSVRNALAVPLYMAVGLALIADLGSAFVSIANFASPVMWSLIAASSAATVAVAATDTGPVGPKRLSRASRRWA